MRHKVGLGAAIFMVIASMLGTGILTTSGMILELVGSPSWVLWIWLVGGLLAFSGAWCYGELIRSVPRSGGEAVFLKELVSPRLGEIAGLTSFVVGFAACNAASSLAISDYLGEALPSVAFEPKLTAFAALLAVTALHGFFGPAGLKIQSALAATKFAILLMLVLVGFAGTESLYGGNLGFTTDDHRFSGSGSSVGIGLMLAMFSYSGWNAAIYAASEVVDPQRNVKRAMLIGSAIVVVLYLALNVLLLSRVAAEDIEGVRPVIALLVKRIFGDQASHLFSGLVAFALLSSLAVSAYLGPRVLATMLNWAPYPAPDGSGYRFNPALVWVQMALSVFMVITGSFLQILTIMGFLLGLFPILSVLGIYRIPGGQAPRMGLRITRLVVAPFFIVTSSIILVLGAINSPAEAMICATVVGAFLGFRQLHLRVFSKARS